MFLMIFIFLIIFDLYMYYSFMLYIITCIITYMYYYIFLIIFFLDVSSSSSSEEDEEIEEEKKTASFPYSGYQPMEFKTHHQPRTRRISIGSESSIEHPPGKKQRSQITIHSTIL